LTMAKDHFKTCTVCNIHNAPKHEAHVKATGGGAYKVRFELIPNNKNFKGTPFESETWDSTSGELDKEGELTELSAAAKEKKGMPFCVRVVVTCDTPTSGNNCIITLSKIEFGGAKNRRLLDNTILEWSDGIEIGSEDKLTLGAWMGQHKITAVVFPISLISAIALTSLIVKRTRRNRSNCEAELLSEMPEVTETSE